MYTCHLCGHIRGTPDGSGGEDWYWFPDSPAEKFHSRRCAAIFVCGLEYVLWLEKQDWNEDLGRVQRERYRPDYPKCPNFGPVTLHLIEGM